MGWAVRIQWETVRMYSRYTVGRGDQHSLKKQEDSQRIESQITITRTSPFQSWSLVKVVLTSVGNRKI